MRHIWMLGGVALLLAAGVVGGGCTEEKHAAVETPLPKVEVVPATEGYIDEAATAIGELKPFNEVALVARVEGFLKKRNFEEGQLVRAGQLLYEIEPEIYEAKVKAAEGAVEKARAAKQNADGDYDRQKQLIGDDATSKRAFDNASAAKMEADAALKSAEAELALAKQNLSYTKIFAPFDGRISLSKFSEGNLVNQSSGTLASVVSVDPMRAEFVITEPDLLRLQQFRKGDKSIPPLRIRLLRQDGSEYPHQGKISYWDNRVNPTTGTFRIQAVFPNPGQDLVPGMFVKISIAPETPRKTLLIPLQAIMNDQAGEYVYVVDPSGTVVRRDIRVSFRNRRLAVVAEGLNPGEQVITSGTQKVRPGAKAVPVVDQALLGEIPLTPEAAVAETTPEKAPEKAPENEKK